MIEIERRSGKDRRSGAERRISKVSNLIGDGTGSNCPEPTIKENSIKANTVINIGNISNNEHSTVNIFFSANQSPSHSCVTLKKSSDAP